MTKNKFKIMYPSDYYDTKKAGKPYLPDGEKMVVMSGGGVFFLVNLAYYERSVTKLSNVLRKFDVVWK